MNHLVQLRPSNISDEIVEISFSDTGLEALAKTRPLHTISSTSPLTHK